MLLANTPRLRAACNNSTGFANFDLAALTAANVIGKSAPSANAEAVANFACGLLLSTAHTRIRSQAAHNQYFNRITKFRVAIALCVRSVLESARYRVARLLECQRPPANLMRDLSVSRMGILPRMHCRPPRLAGRWQISF